MFEALPYVPSLHSYDRIISGGIVSLAIEKLSSYRSFLQNVFMTIELMAHYKGQELSGAVALPESRTVEY